MTNEIDLEELETKATEAAANIATFKDEIQAMLDLDATDYNELRKKANELHRNHVIYTRATNIVNRETMRAEREAKIEEARARREAEKEARREAAEELKKKKAAELEARKEANKMPEQNGVRRPKPDTQAGALWAMADKMSEVLNSPVSGKEFIEAAELEGYKISSIRTQFAMWRKFYGLTKPKAPATSKAPTEALKTPPEPVSKRTNKAKPGVKSRAKNTTKAEPKVEAEQPNV